MDEATDVTLTGADGVQYRLEARLGSGDRGGAVVAPPHPLYGGRLDNPVVVALARGLTQARIAALRFNFRGTGESEGEPSADPAQADADFSAALARLTELGAGPYCGAGYSFGAATALRVAARAHAVERLILIAPPISLLDRAALRAYAGPITLIVGDEDAYAPLDALEQALAGCERATLHVLSGVDHFFGGADFEQVVALIAAAARA